MAIGDANGQINIPDAAMGSLLKVQEGGKEEQRRGEIAEVMTGKAADGTAGKEDQINTGTLEIFGTIHVQFQHLDGGAGRPMGPGAGIKGITEIKLSEE